MNLIKVVTQIQILVQLEFTCPFSKVDTVSVVLDTEWWLAPLGARL